MTLILACLTPTHVYQVSDRRLTALSGASAGAPMDDERNKAVLFEGNIAFGYTGLADLPGDRTDVWLAKTLGSGPTDDLSVVLERVRTSATVVFRSLTLPRPARRHAFAGVGWTKRHGLNELLPTTILIENALDSNSDFEVSARDDFRTRIQQYAAFKRGFAVHSVGARVNPGQRNAILRAVGSLVKRNRSPLALLQTLSYAVRWMATFDSTIGSSLMGLCIPRAAVARSIAAGEIVILSGAPMIDVPTFLYLGANQNRMESYGPTTVAGGWVSSGWTVVRSKGPGPSVHEKDI
ncbi:MAG TPA: hypothetical protein VGL65_14235 [Gemmatimonadales bacterium]|jgi:hypothetical protein